jgi:diaminopimelate epimerase
MQTDFVKMHGLGNDFVVLDGRATALPPVTAPFARALGDRRTGIGFDQMVVLEPSAVADFRARFFNADGSEVQSCGNASRAIGVLIGQAARVETGGGLIDIRLEGGSVAVDMGMPRFGWDQIPLAYAMDTLTMPVGWDNLEAPAAVNVGNPHVVFFVDDPAAVDLHRLGPLIETDPLFPERVNVNVASLRSRSSIQLRVWERGTGETRACGTGACATAIAAMRRGQADPQVTVTQAGGDLTITWTGEGRIVMAGPAEESFRGSFDWEHYA